MLVQYTMNKLFTEFETAQIGLINNLPSRPVAWLLRALTLPLGRSAKAPDDKTVGRIVAKITAPTATRERLIEGTFRSESSNHPMFKYDSLLARADKADPIYKKIGDALKAGKFDEATLTIEGRIHDAVAMGVLTQNEGDFMIEFEKDVLEMINVDHFPLEHFGPVTIKYQQPVRKSGRQNEESEESALA